MFGGPSRSTAPMAVAAGITSAESVARRVSQTGSGPGNSRMVTPQPGSPSDGDRPGPAGSAPWAPVSLPSGRSVMTSTLPVQQAGCVRLGPEGDSGSGLDEHADRVESHFVRCGLLGGGGD